MKRYEMSQNLKEEIRNLTDDQAANDNVVELNDDALQSVSGGCGCPTSPTFCNEV